MKRRSFLIRIGGVVVAAPVALNLIACGGDDPPDPEPDSAPPQDSAPDSPSDGNGGNVDCTANGAQVNNISADHGHNRGQSISAEDINNPMTRVYDVTGVSGHPHTILLEATHFEMLAAGQTVSVRSSFDAGHDHLVTIVCV